jgi:hypothetical protein
VERGLGLGLESGSLEQKRERVSSLYIFRRGHIMEAVEDNGIGSVMIEPRVDRRLRRGVGSMCNCM